MIDLLVVAAHPDDEVLGSGGVLSRMSREGRRAHVLIVTEGATTQYPDRPELVGRKRDEAAAAMDELGGVAVTFAELPDMRLSNMPIAEVVSPIAELVSGERPRWVITHDAGDLNADHRTVHEATRVACRPSAEHAPRLSTCEILSSTEWGWGPFTPSSFVVLEEEDLERKIAALERYQTEVRSWPHPRSPEAVRQLARMRGAQIGATAAEAFHLVWERW